MFTYPSKVEAGHQSQVQERRDEFHPIAPKGIHDELVVYNHLILPTGDTHYRHIYLIHHTQDQSHCNKWYSHTTQPNCVTEGK